MVFLVVFLVVFWWFLCFLVSFGGFLCFFSVFLVVF